ncbi:MAG TPA: hypothetical protein DGG94_19605 [Micromonosporaceae bacterium]|nr:hypothetical protein [Micromonosporaceae bacterium]HCU51975.1 hypothetical protein [Micromonosporaceae bacterium]
MNRWRLVSLVLCVAGAGSIWVIPGDELKGGTRAAALLALAGVGALLAGRGLFRRLVAIAVVLAGVRLGISESWASFIGGALVMIGGGIAVLTSHNWPVMGARYERGAKAQQPDMWSAIDRGEDPTAR